MAKSRMVRVWRKSCPCWLDDPPDYPGYLPVLGRVLGRLVGVSPATVRPVACRRYSRGTMRVTVAIDLEIADGKRPGTRYGRAERIARALGAFADRLNTVSSVRSFEVRQPADGDQPGAVLMSFDGSEVWPMGLPARKTEG